MSLRPFSQCTTPTPLLHSFQDELIKVGARRGLRIIRDLVNRGGAKNLAKAQNLALKQGVLKSSVGGSQVKDLGRGMEGVSSLVAHPQRGVVVRKLYDPHGIATAKQIAHKGSFARSIKDPVFPKFHGEAKSQVGTPMHFYEYVQGKSPMNVKRFNSKMSTLEKEYGLAKGSGNRSRMKEVLSERDQLMAVKKRTEGAIDKSLSKAKELAKTKGYDMRDLHLGNILQTPEGKTKVVDYMLLKGKMKDSGLRIPTKPEEYFLDPKMKDRIKRLAFRKGGPPPLPKY